MVSVSAAVSGGEVVGEEVGQVRGQIMDGLIGRLEDAVFYAEWRAMQVLSRGVV